MLSTTRELAENQPAEGTSAPSSNLTKEQQDATIRKWADWILRQRKLASAAKTTVDNHKD